MKDSTYQKDVTERIKRLITKRGVSPAEYAKLIGISQAGISSKLNGKSPWTTPDIRKISVFENVPRDWILYGKPDEELREGEVILEYQEKGGNFHFNSDDSNIYEETSGYTTIARSDFDMCSDFTNMMRNKYDFAHRKYPTTLEVQKEWEIFKENKEGNLTTTEITRPRLPTTAAAGNLSEYLDGYMAHHCEQMPIIRRFPEYDFTMFIRGNSMEPKYEGGDEIALKEATIIEWGKDYVLATSEGAIFKKIYDAGDNIRCVSYNREEYPDFLVPKSSIYGYYRCVGLIRT